MAVALLEWVAWIINPTRSIIWSRSVIPDGIFFALAELMAFFVVLKRDGMRVVLYGGNVVFIKE